MARYKVEMVLQDQGEEVGRIEAVVEAEDPSLVSLDEVIAVNPEASTFTLDGLTHIWINMEEE